MRSKLRVVFTGHTGLGKIRVLEKLRSELLNHPNSPRVEIFDAEMGLDVEYLLDLQVRLQQQTWKEAFEEFETCWQKNSPDVDIALISMHLTYHHASHAFSPLSWVIPEKYTVDCDRHDVLMRFLKEQIRPDYFVTLIDDAHYVKQRVQSHGTHDFRLRDLIKWRNMEMETADTVAAHAIPSEVLDQDTSLFPYERSPIFAIRHPTKMLCQYLTKPKIPRVYASFPISQPRKLGSDVMEEINRFKQKLEEHFTVFDPSTIDELPIQAAFKNLDGDASELPLTSDDHWPSHHCIEDVLCETDRTDVLLNIDDVREIAREVPDQKSELRDHVQRRDYRLIDQSDFVAIYRPTYGGREDYSGGTYHEAVYANQTGKPILIIKDQELDGNLSPETIGFAPRPAQRLNNIGNLHEREQQDKVLEKLVCLINEKSEELTSRRIRVTH